jgi:hypothetical protein
VLRRIFGPKTDEITGNCRKLHSEQLNNLYSSPNINQVIKSRRMRWAVHAVRMRKGEEHKAFGWKPEGKSPLRRRRCRWEDNIIMDLQEVGRSMDWIDLAQDRDK